MAVRTRTPHLIGREAPLRELFDALDAVDDSGRLVLLAGEAGIGKSRLLDEFAARAEGVRVVRGGCVEGVSYAPWVDALWWLAGGAQADLVAGLTTDTRATLAHLLPELGVPSDSHDDDMAGQQRLFEAVVALLAHVTAGARTVLVVDDIHWIDPASRELLRFVAANLTRLRLLLVCAYRPEDSEQLGDLLTSLDAVCRHRIALAPLPPEDAADIATYLIGDDTGPVDLEQIINESGGNPLFVEELVAARGSAEMPHTVRDLMLVRFESLNRDARQLVSVAAVIGNSAPGFWLSGAAHLADPNDAIASAIDAGILHNDEESYTFRHALLRQAVLDHIGPDERVSLHRAVAGALADQPFHKSIDRTAELARHWDAAGDADHALQWLIAAARQAESRYAFEAASHAYERALHWWPAADHAALQLDVDYPALLLAAADAAGHAGHVDRAADLGQAAVEEAATVDVSRAVAAAAATYPLMWTADRAPEFFDYASTRLMPALDEVDSHARAAFLISAVEHLMDHAPIDETLEAADRMMSAITTVDDHRLEARAHSTMAQVYELTGDFELVDAAFNRAAELARSAEAHSLLALILYNNSAFHLAVPRYTAVPELLDEVDELIERFHIGRLLLPARYQRAMAALMEGRLDQVREILQSVEHRPAQGHDADFRQTMYGRLAIASGDYESALAAVSPQVGTSEFAVQFQVIRCDALAWTGQLEAAFAAATTGLAIVETYADPYIHGLIAMTALRVAADQTVIASAQRHLSNVERGEQRGQEILDRWTTAVRLRQSRHPLAIAYTLACEAEVSRLRGLGCAQASVAAAEQFDAISIPYYATYFRFRAGEAAIEDGDRALARELLDRAAADAQRHGFNGLTEAITTLARTKQLRMAPGNKSIDGDVALSARELEVLKLIADGHTNPEIATHLSISPHTARAHASNVMRKLDVGTRVEAVSEAVRRGIV